MKKYNILILILFLQSCFIFAQKEIKNSFTTEIKRTVSYNYFLNIPENKSKEKLPLIVFLHGSGERGDNLELVKVNGPYNYMIKNNIKAGYLAPQCPENMLWDEDALMKMIDEVVKKNNFDETKIYITGLSMGGWGVWNLISKYPDYFAAAIPVCGIVDRIPMMEFDKMKNLPIYIFHGALDDVVPFEYSLDVYKKLHEVNPKVFLEIISYANHNSWDYAYNRKETYDWLFKQKKN